MSDSDLEVVRRLYPGATSYSAEHLGIVTQLLDAGAIERDVVGALKITSVGEEIIATLDREDAAAELERIRPALVLAGLLKQ